MMEYASSWEQIRTGAPQAPRGATTEDKARTALIGQAALFFVVEKLYCIEKLRRTLYFVKKDKVRAF